MQLEVVLAAALDTSNSIINISIPWYTSSFSNDVIIFLRTASNSMISLFFLICVMEGSLSSDAFQAMGITCLKTYENVFAGVNIETLGSARCSRDSNTVRLFPAIIPSLAKSTRYFEKFHWILYILCKALSFCLKNDQLPIIADFVDRLKDRIKFIFLFRNAIML